MSSVIDSSRVETRRPITCRLCSLAVMDWGLLCAEWMGEQEPTDAVHDAVGIVAACLLLGLADWVFFRRSPGRWFFIHTLANGVVSLFSLVDAYSAVADPIHALEGPHNRIPSHWVAAVHIYHLIIFARELTTDDVVHHVLFGGVICGTGLALEVGPAANLVGLFICGAPGGVSYWLLGLRKTGSVSSEAEKSWNARINVWIRAPGCLLAAFTIYVSWLYGSPPSSPFVLFSVATLLYVNGNYYMARVVSNAGKRVDNFQGGS